MDTVNIDFIAKKAGCSPATVSRVLNKSKRVSSELEQRVYDVIAKYDYHPNAMARGLATKRSRLIGIIFPEQMNQYHLYLLQCLNTRITEAGYNVSMAFAKERAYRRQTMLRQVQAYHKVGFDGMKLLFGKPEWRKADGVSLCDGCIRILQSRKK